MYDILLVRHCAPTLAGLKTGSLFSCPFPRAEVMRTCLLRWNNLLAAHGLSVLPLGCRRGRTLVYLYLPHALLHDLTTDDSAQLLRELGYPLPCPQRCLAFLRRRLARSLDFPHELGLFLGYPPEDVRGFLRDPAACKFSGCWKVYGDAQAAKARFSTYHSCTQTYCNLLAHGTALQHLPLMSQYFL